MSDAKHMISSLPVGGQVDIDDDAGNKFRVVRNSEHDYQVVVLRGVPNLFLFSL